MANATTLIPRGVAKVSNSPTLAVQSYFIAYGLMKGYSLANIKWMCKQFRLETASGTSNVFESFHNVSGMGCVQVRENKQNGCYTAPNGENIGTYKNVNDSVCCRFLWDAYFGFDTDKRSTLYPAVVSERYHGSPDYMASVDAVSVPNWNLSIMLTLATLPLEFLLIKKIWNF